VQDGTEPLLPSEVNKYLTSEYAEHIHFVNEFNKGLKTAISAQAIVPLFGMFNRLAD